MEKRYSLLALAVAGALSFSGSKALAQRSATGFARAPHVRTGHPLPGGHQPTLRGSAPANDECANAEALMLHTQAECATMATAGNNGSSVGGPGDPSCDASDTGYQDVWYSFNSGANEVVLVTLTPSAEMTDWAFVVSTGCDATEDIHCEVVPEGAIEVAVTPNTDYVVRVYSNLDWGVGDAFTLCLVGAGDVPDPPANDDCSGATPHDLAVGGSLDITGDNAGATDNEGFGFDSAWESFTLAECANVTVDFCGTNPPFVDFETRLGNSCPLDAALAPTTQDVCGDGNNVVVTYQGLAAGTYYIPVLRTANSSGPYSIHVSAAACPPPPANDNCSGAISLQSNPTCVSTDGNTANATESLAAVECNTFTGTADDDVWYSFQATTVDQTISVMGVAGFDAVIELFSGSCDALTHMECGDFTFPETGVEDTGDSLSYSGFTVGETYYFRVYEWSARASSPSTNFSVCVMEGLNGNVGIVEQADVAFTVFPNPNNGDFSIAYGAASGAVGVQVLDLTGRVVYNGQRNMTKGQTVTLPLAGKLAVGQYLLRLDTPEGRKDQRITVQ